MSAAEAVRAALAELVAVHDLKLALQRGWAEHELPQMRALKAEYGRRKPMAWEAARKALELSVPSERTFGDGLIKLHLCHQDTVTFQAYRAARDLAKSINGGKESLEFMWNGVRWVYSHTFFDITGQYDVIIRPVPPKEVDHA